MMITPPTDTAALDVGAGLLLLCYHYLLLLLLLQLLLLLLRPLLLLRLLLGALIIRIMVLAHYTIVTKIVWVSI